MRAQISLETLIVSAAVAGILVMLAAQYARLTDIAFRTINEKAAEYVVSLVETAADGCNSSRITVAFPFKVRLECSPVKLCVGDACREVRGVSCSAGGEGERVSVQNCSISVT